MQTICRVSAETAAFHARPICADLDDTCITCGGYVDDQEYSDAQWRDELPECYACQHPCSTDGCPNGQVRGSQDQCPLCELRMWIDESRDADAPHSAYLYACAQVEVWTARVAEFV